MSARGFQFGDPGEEWYANAIIDRSEILTTPSRFTSPGGETLTHEMALLSSPWLIAFSPETGVSVVVNL